MKQAIYITYGVKELIDFENNEQFTNDALQRAEEIKKSCPNSIIEDIEIINGLVTTSIK